MRWLVVLLVVSLASPAWAEDPWKVGVTDEQKASAKTLLDAGNALFFEKRYPEALKKYEEAYAVWNHPAIRFNIVRCLIQLERPDEAFDNLEAALVYGAAPLEENVYREALSYQKLLANQIGTIEVSCTQPQVRLSLDGQPLHVACPGRVTRRVKPGPHQVTGVKDGFVARSVDVKVVGGTMELVPIELASVARASREVRRWAVWKPWLAFGSGLVVLGAGTGLQLIASSDLDTYDRQITFNCARVACDPVASPQIAKLVEDRDRALLENRIAIGMIAVGATATVAGIVLLYVNRSVTVVEPAVSVAVDRNGAGVLFGVRL